MVTQGTFDHSAVDFQNIKDELVITSAMRLSI